MSERPDSVRSTLLLPFVFHIHAAMISCSLLGMCVLSFSSALLAEPVSIAALPYSILKPGEYRLASDLTFPANRGAAITITASDVFLDLGSRRLDGAGGSESSAVGISSLDQSRVTIRNGTISGFYFGIDLRRSRREAEASSGHRIEGVRLERNWYFGIRLEGGQSTVTACEVLDTGGCTRPSHTIPHGIRLVGPGNTLEECRVLDLRLKRWPEEKGEVVGVHFDDARGSVMRGCVIREEASTTDEDFPDAASRPRRFGVWVNGGPDGDTFLKVNGNTFSGFDVGLAFSRGTDGEVKGNTFEKIRFDPIRGAPAKQLEQNQTR
jgi:hypothetical protein